MQQLRTLWDSMDMRRRMVVLAATVGVFVAVLALARVATAPSMALLYSGLEGPTSGQVIEALEQRGLRYEVRGDAIYIEQSARDETRMALAAQGLPANSSTGYELLDGLTGFGTTSQMFDAAYWRAKEGELARTIMASPHIRHARVHISQVSTQPFRRAQQGSASVTVTPSGAPLSPAQAQSLRFLVASAVAGLTAADVSVIDGASGQVIGEERGETGLASDRADQLRRNVERLVEARVGAGRAVVEVNVETVTDRETIVERLIAPESRTAMSQETEESTATASDSGGQGVSVASNLPDGDAAATQGSSQSRESSTRERIDWDVSQTSREIERAPGAVRRITVAVLVDGARTIDASGAEQWTPRPAEELEALRALVASAVGFDAARGDEITIRSLEFEPLPALGAEGAAAGWVQTLDVNGLIRMAGLALVVLILSLFVLRPLFARQPDGAEGTALSLPPVAPNAAAALEGEIERYAPLEMAAQRMTSERPDGLSMGPAEDPVERMRTLLTEREDDALEVLRAWMEEPEEAR